jgi:hypothetical protein
VVKGRDEATEPGDGAGRNAPWQAVPPASGDGSPPPPVRLLREWKGLTVADLLRDEIVERLPGQLRSALQHLERRDFAAAERAVPGEFAPLLPGPGAARTGRPGRWRLVLVGLAAVGFATLASRWFQP